MNSLGLVYALFAIGMTAACGSVIASEDVLFSARPMGEDGFTTGPDSVYRGEFANGGNSFYFFRKTSPGTEDYRMFVSHRQREGWSVPEILTLGGEHSDLYPAVSPDGSMLVFSSYRPLPDGSEATNPNIWMSVRTRSGWGDPEFVESINLAGHYHAAPRFEDDSTLIFRRISPDRRSRIRMTAEVADGAFAAPRAFPISPSWRSSVEDGVVVLDARLSPQGDVMILEVSRIDSNRRLGEINLMYSWNTGGEWSDPQPMQGGVSVDGEHENFAAFSPDGQSLSFVRHFREMHEVSTQIAAPKPAAD